MIFTNYQKLRTNTLANTPLYLIWAGALPFFIGVLLLSLNINQIPALGRVNEVMAAYGLVVCVYLAGIHWGQQLSLGKEAAGLFVSSNIFTIATWLAWLLLPATFYLIFLIFPFTMLLIIDRALFMSGVLQKTYIQTRAIVTVLVISCLVMSVIIL